MTQYVRILGTLEEGFKFYGPYSEKDFCFLVPPGYGDDVQELLPAGSEPDDE